MRKKIPPMYKVDFSKKVENLPDIWGTDIEYNSSKGLFLKGMTGTLSGDYTPIKHFHNTAVGWVNSLFHLCGYNQQKKIGGEIRVIEKCIVVAHYGDIAEFSWIIKTIFDNPDLAENIKIDPVISGNKMLRLTLIHKNGKVVILQDTSAYFIGGLADFAKTFARQFKKSENGPDFSREDYNHEKHIEYLENDVLSCVDAYLGLRKLIVENFQCPMKVSLPATAYAAWLTTIPQGHVYFRQNSMVEDFCRDGYYGGYVHPGYDDLVHKNVIGADRTAAYGSIMKDFEFPVGTGIYTRSYVNGKMGIYRCKVTAINPMFPMIPYRIKNDKNETLYSSYLGIHGDTCVTVITSDEIDFCKNYGYEIEIIEGIYWRKTEPIFLDLMLKCQLLEKRGGSYKDVAKLIRNSLYGKFGAKTEIEKFICSDKPQPGMTPFQEEHRLSSNTYLWSKTEELNAPYIMPHWAAFITAKERIWLFRQILGVGIEHFHGADTDCVTGDAEQIQALNLNISSNYGDIQLEKVATLYRSRGPKMYAFEGTYKGVFTRMLKAKGVSKKLMKGEEAFKRFMHSDDEWEVSGERPTKSLTMMKNPDTPLSVKFTKYVSLLHSDHWYLENHLFKIYPHPEGPFKEEFIRLKIEHDRMFKERKLSRLRKEVL